jgi:hypothetical protein
MQAECTTRQGSSDAPKGDAGFALIGALIITVMVLAIGSIGVQSSTIGLSIAANDLHSNQALTLAEGGIDHAISLIEADPDGFDDELGNGGVGGALSALGSIVSMQGKSYRFHQTSESGSGYYLRVEDNYDETTGADDPTVDVDQSFRIVSRGRVGGAERMVEVLVRGEPLFPYLVWTRNDIYFTATGNTDSFDSRVAPYVPPGNSNGDLYADDDIILVGGIADFISGDLSAGDTINPGGYTLYGGSHPSAAELNRSGVAPCAPYQPDTTGITGGSYTAATGRLEASAGVNVFLADGQYCFDDIVLTGGSSLVVNGPVTISLTGQLDAQDGVIVNTTSLASNLLIFVNGGGAVKISGGATAYMAIHARHSVVEIDNGGEFYGAVVAWNFRNNAGTNLHFDEALTGILTNDDLERLVWREVKTL